MSLNHLPMFDGVPADHLQWAQRYFKEVMVDFGTPLISEGESDTSMIIVVSGQLEMSTGGVLLGTADSGEIVGEVALFGSGVRSASVEALTQCRLLILDRAGYIQLRNHDSPIAHTIEQHALELTSERLRATSQKISKMAEGTPVEHVAPSPGFFSRVASVFGAGGLGAGPSELDKVSALRKSALFADGTDIALDELALHFSSATASPGTFVCTEGDHGGEMYVLVDGTVEVMVDLGDDLAEPLATLEPGDAFGMCSLIDHEEPRMASCVVREAAVLLTLETKQWANLSSRHDQAGSVLRTAMLRALAESLSYANGQLAMLDMSRQMQALTAERINPLTRASAGMETHGGHS